MISDVLLRTCLARLAMVRSKRNIGMAPQKPCEPPARLHLLLLRNSSRAASPCKRGHYTPTYLGHHSQSCWSSTSWWQDLKWNRSTWFAHNKAKDLAWAVRGHSIKACWMHACMLSSRLLTEKPLLRYKIPGENRQQTYLRITTLVLPFQVN